jgi:hypothetical protein
MAYERRVARVARCAAGGEAVLRKSTRSVSRFAGGCLRLTTAVSAGQARVTRWPAMS